MVDTRKFSDFADGGDLSNNDTTVGLKSGSNTQFNNPWTYLPPGNTASRPAPSSTINYRLRFNTEIFQYEYYDANSSAWTQLAEDVSAVNSIIGTIHQVKANGAVGTPTFGNVTLTTPQDIDTTSNVIFNSMVLATALNPSYGGTGVQNASGSTLTLGGATRFLGAHTVDFIFPLNTSVTFPSSGTLATVGGTIASITGVANQVLVNGTSGSPQTGAVTLTLPQDINTTSSPTFLAVTAGNLNLSGNSIVSTNTDGNINIIPNGNGIININGSTPFVAKSFGDVQLVDLDGSGAFSIGTFGILPMGLGSQFNGYSSNGTGPGNFNKILSGQGISTFNAYADDGVGFSRAGSMVFICEGTASAGIVPGQWRVYTSNTAGVLTLGITLNAAQTVILANALPIASGGTAVTSVTTSPTATSFAGWDANSNLSANNFLAGYATTATAGLTTTLTVASKRQQYFTGATTQTVILPVTSTLVLGFSFEIVNNSSGNVTVQSSGGNVITVQAGNTSALYTCILTSGTTDASWNSNYSYDTAGVGSITGTANQVIASSSIGDVTLSLPQSIATTSSPTFAALTLTTPLNYANGGTGANLTASNGGILYSTATTAAILAGTATARQMLQSGASSPPAWSTTTWPATTTINRILFSSSASVIGEISAAAGGVLISNSSSVPSMLANPSATGRLLSSVSGDSSVWTTATFPVTSGSSGTILRSNGTNWVNSTSTFADTYSASTLLYSNGANTVTGLATANNGILVTSAGGVPSIGNTVGAGLTMPSITFNTTTGIVGTTTNDSAAAGSVGEFVSSIIGSASAISISTDTSTDLTSISLTAGDWTVWGNIVIATTGASTIAQTWTSSVSATLPDASVRSLITSTTTNGIQGFVAPVRRFSLNSTTTIYVSARVTFSTGTATFYGGIQARRVR